MRRSECHSGFRCTGLEKERCTLWCWIYEVRANAFVVFAAAGQYSTITDEATVERTQNDLSYAPAKGRKVVSNVLQFGEVS